MDATIRLSRAANGFEVCLTDPEIEKKNRDTKTPGWRDPVVKYVFADIAGVTEFLSENMEQVLTAADDEYETSFQKALKGDT